MGMEAMCVGFKFPATYHWLIQKLGVVMGDLDKAQQQVMALARAAGGNRISVVSVFPASQEWVISIDRRDGTTARVAGYVDSKGIPDEMIARVMLAG